jgi:hypothetical protein
MQSRPTEPTSALAALIAGNHRHLERLKVGAQAGAEPHDRGVQPTLLHPFPQRPFALAVAAPGPVAVTPRIFALGHHEVLVVDALHEVADRAVAHDVKLIVVIETIPQQAVSTATTWRNAEWRHAESRAFSRVESILRGGAGVRAAIAKGEVRMVAALLEHPGERVHWIGEHPESDLIAREP